MLIKNNKVYDVLKFIAQIVLPAIGTFIFSLKTVWGIPYAQEIVGTLTAVDGLLGVFLKAASDRYHREEPDIEETEDTDDE